MMYLLFSKNPSSWFSKAILTITREPVSHVAFQLGRWVLHANWRGVHAQSYETFQKQNQIVYKLSVPSVSEDAIMEAFSRREFKPYDLLAIIWFAAHLLLRRYLPQFTPKINLLQHTSMDFCVELVQHLMSRPVDSLTTPYQLFVQLQKGE